MASRGLLEALEGDVVQGGGHGDVAEPALNREFRPRPEHMAEIGVVVLILVGAVLVIGQEDVESVRAGRLFQDGHERSLAFRCQGGRS